MQTTLSKNAPMVLADPETGEDLVADSPAEHDGKDLVFTGRNPRTGSRWRFRLGIEEIGEDE